MIFLTHLATGYLISQAIINKINSTGVDKGLLTSLAIAGAIAPDVDGLFGKQMRDHRKTPFHAPLAWAVLILMIYLLILLTNNTQLAIYLLVFAIGVFTHLFLDWFSSRTSGVWIFYPFSKKLYSLFPLDQSQGKVSIFPNRKNFQEYLKFVKFFFKNKFLVITELLINLVVFFVWFKSK